MGISRTNRIDSTIGHMDSFGDLEDLLDTHVRDSMPEDVAIDGVSIAEQILRRRVLRERGGTGRSSWRSGNDLDIIRIKT